MAENQTRTRARPITDLVPDLKNANRGTQRGLGLLEDSLREHGAGRSVLVDRHGRIIAGNKTVERAVDLGFQEVLLVPTDGTRLVAVQRTDLDLESDPRARALALADNRVAELDLEWDPALLAEIHAADPAALRGLWTNDELDDLLAEILRPAAGEDPGPQTDRAEELRAKWGTDAGQVWRIPSATVPSGAHRLAVGDCTAPAVLDLALDGRKAEMVWTDPPYGVDIGEKNLHLNKYGRSNRREEHMKGDTARDLERLLRAAFAAALARCAPGAPWYVASPSGPIQRLFLQILTDLGVWRQTLVWAKQRLVLGRGDYHYQHEAILYGWAPGAAHAWHGGRKLVSLLNRPRPVQDLTLAELQDLARAIYEDSDLIEVGGPTRSPEHPTAKPPGLVARNIRPSSRPGALVLDPFAGSGSTAVACEQEARLAALVEIEPAYAASILERLSGMGLAPERGAAHAQ